jgi:hypothetical protein
MILYYVPVIEFNYVMLPTDRVFFSRIGIEDRNFVMVLGSALLFISIFLIMQLIFGVLYVGSQCLDTAKKWMTYFYCETPYRTIVIIFFLETYIDLLLGGLVNTENEYLTTDANNWGPNGYMTKGDQISIILGYICYIGCMFFPFIVWYILEIKKSLMYSPRIVNINFDNVYGGLFESYKTNLPGFLQYFSVYLVRKQLYAHIAFYLNDEFYTVLQVYVNLLVNFFFIIYLAVV